jgi:hypothetical protein
LVGFQSSFQVHTRFVIVFFFLPYMPYCMSDGISNEGVQTTNLDLYKVIAVLFLNFGLETGQSLSSGRVVGPKQFLSRVTGPSTVKEYGTDSVSSV